MENCDILRKSVLKKSDLSVIKKGKKVTFCSTVKVFIHDGSSDQKIKITDPQSNCVEVNIVDKSSDDYLNSPDISKNDDCNATDFLVHKVIYENGIDPDDDTDVLSEEADESSILFENNADEEGLQFVVHKVTDHEDDLIQQELDLEDCDTGVCFSEEMECNRDIIGKLSELSIENILTHDKIIAFIDENTLGLSSLLKSHVNSSEMNSLPLLKDPVKDPVNVSTVSSCLKNTELVLSPPLQELSLDKIVKAHSDNVLCELDISPLNSIQETDSDSDVSSEGTMIMMTTEESEKNEQHIRESFQKYESLKKEKVQTKDSAVSPKLQTITESETLQNLYKKALENIDHSSTDCTFIKNLNESTDKKINFDTNLGQVTPVEETNSKAIESHFESEDVKRVKTSSLANNPFMSYDKDVSVFRAHEPRKMSFTTIKDSCYWDKSLASVQIPKDVREWKILSSPEKMLKSDSLNADPSLNSCTLYEGDYLSLKLNGNSHLPERYEPSQSVKSDELESFVHASKERVQRIRKRYLDKTQRKMGVSNSPVRGIRPRFGSTAEILQLMQKKNQPPLVTFNPRNHVSWPCVDTFSNSGINVQNRKQLTHMFGCQSLPCEYSLQSSFSSNISEDSSSSACDHDSVSSCPSIFFHERGSPEGASPPRSLSEDSIEQYNNEENPSNVVYFSMKV